MEDCTPQLMISYQWDSRKDVLKLHQALTDDRYCVWIDEEQMHENIYERMAEAVRESSLILLCMTKKYEDSDICKGEFLFAKDLKKKIIPIYLEKEYKPGGSLGIIIAGKLYFDITNKDNFDNEICKIKGEINKQLDEIGTD